MTRSVDLVDSPFAPFAKLARAGEWSQSIAVAEAAQEAGEAPDGVAQLLLAIAKVRSGIEPLSAITLSLVRGGDKNDLRRSLLNPLIQEGALDDATQVLSLIIEAEPPALRDVRQRSSLYARLRRWDEALADVDRVIAAEPSDPVAGAMRIQYRIISGKAREAIDIIEAMPTLPMDSRTLNLVLVAMIREAEFVAAADVARRIDPGAVDDPRLAGNIVQALFRSGADREAIDVGERFLKRMMDGPALRCHLAQAWLVSGAMNERFANAIEHLQAGLLLAPEDLRIMSLLGQALLRTGKAKEAIPHLKKSTELQPRMAEIRVLYARALKQAGKFDEAAEQFSALLANVPHRTGRWQRHAAGALSQAGRREEASAMFDAWISSRAQRLPQTFQEGLEGLWANVDEVEIPKARLDWAWQLRDPNCSISRGEWERRAKWGHLADHYLLDWIECRGEQLEEAMHYFAEVLDAAETFISEARARAPGKGLVMASAHVGAMYFGPLALELVGERCRWLASTPSSARTAYAENLISTSDQTELQVARAFMQGLKQDYAIVVGVDGAINLSSPRIEFEGQEITFSDFSARTAQQMGSPSVFAVPVWQEDNRLGFVAEHLPMPEERETPQDYARRWKEAYLGHLRALLGGRPENLRLSGGIWRHIR